ncbi:MAG TPA: biotin/lipoate A/B protein ligase family protein [Gemmatimonadaceae bacterium]|nr:biotin/lipoate A/B protein ligase family protein [Gemmatimonadaceae bacterium]
MLTPPARGAYNMALDEALMRYAREADVWVLRVYSWSSPTLSFGRNQRALGGYDLSRLREQHIDVVRRPTGGRAILHHREITYAVAAPLDDAGDLRESYARINRLLIAGLRALGVGGVQVAGRVEKTRHRTDRLEGSNPGLVPCYHHPSVGEITVFGRKLVGSAQWRSKGALLQHGSILVDDDQLHLSSLLIDPGDPIPRPATLREVLHCPPTDRDMARALFDAVRENEDPHAVEIDVGPALLEHAQALQAHYLDDRWTWLR